jgi:predicted RNase H-like HicB family nuclease
MHGMSIVEYRVFTEPDEDDGGWIAWSDDLPGTMSQGETEAEALDHLGEAIGLAISVHMMDAESITVDTVHERTVRIA